MNNLQTFNISQKKIELELLDEIKKSSELNTMLLNLFYTISHNLNTYTGNIKTLLDFIDQEIDPIENRISLNHLRTVSNDLNSTLTDLSQIIYVQNSINIVKQDLNLKEYLDKVKNIVDGYSIKNKFSFINNVPKEALVTYNRAYLESILLNFTTNAIKYAHPERFPEIEFSFSIENGNKVLTISDNGIGIDLDRYGDSLFGLNQTFHQHENASGIGLYITKYQIEAMKGKISVTSNVGEGTTFKIFFL